MKRHLSDMTTAMLHDTAFLLKVLWTPPWGDIRQRVVQALLDLAGTGGGCVWALAPPALVCS